MCFHQLHRDEDDTCLLSKRCFCIVSIKVVTVKTAESCLQWLNYNYRPKIVCVKYDDPNCLSRRCGIWSEMKPEVVPEKFLYGVLLHNCLTPMLYDNWLNQLTTVVLRLKIWKYRHNLWCVILSGDISLVGVAVR